ncbi:hypothetical protein P2318_11035 [Myxococcaceae bacterium GXIMD 01537]
MRNAPSKPMSLLTEPEVRLVLSSAPRNVTGLTPRELRTRIQRSRRLVEKYRDKAQRQRREALGKQRPTRGRRAQGNQNTLRKVAFLQLALTRFEKRLALLEARLAVSTARRAAARGRTVRKAATARKVTTARKAVSGRKPARRTRAAGRTAKRKVSGISRQKRGGALKQQRALSRGRVAHGVARNRRVQARRDQRR